MNRMRPEYQSAAQTLRLFRVPMFITLAGLVLSLFLFLWVLSTQFSRAREDFDVAVDYQAGLVQSAFVQVETELLMLHEFFNASKLVTEDEFKAFTDAFQHNDGVRSLLFMKLDEHGKYYPAYRTGPETSKNLPTYIDDAITKAVAAPILVARPEEMGAYVISVEDGTQKGVVVALFDIGKLANYFDGAVENPREFRPILHIFSRDFDVPLFSSSAPEVLPLRTGPPSMAKMKKFAVYAVVHPLNTGGHQLEMLFLTPHGYFTHTNHPLAWFMFVAGMVVTALLSYLTFRITRDNVWVHEEVNKKTEQLHESKERLQAVVDNAVDGIITINVKGLIQTYNPACEKIFGYSVEEVIGKNIKMLMTSENREKHDGYIHNYLSTNKAKIIGIGREVMGKRKDGKTVPLDLSVSKFSTLDGKIMFSGILRDITERKQAEESQDKLIDRLQSSNEELERFAYVCSHDLQEPLRMVSCFSDKLEGYLKPSLGDDEKAQRYFKHVIDGAKRAQELIHDILAYASLDRETKKSELVDLNVLIEVIQENMSLSLEERGGKITHDPLPTVTGNKTQLHQILQNLVGNGLKYQKSGTKPHVHVHAKETSTHWQISVKDNGIGMEERHLKEVFQVFKRLHRRDEYSGTGIGLSICKKVADNHGGKIWVESEKGKGSTFYFTLKKVKKPTKKES